MRWAGYASWRLDEITPQIAQWGEDTFGGRNPTGYVTKRKDVIRKI